MAVYTDASLLEFDAAESVHRPETTYREVNGVRLHVVAAGEADAPLVVLLHGFPEFFYGWRHQIGPLVEAGYRVLVPDQRGYNLSEKPSGISAYQRAELSRDVVELVRSEGRDSAHVVGHDWGAAVAWDVALRYPDVVDRLTIVNVPHPSVQRRHLRSNLEQLRRSWYVFYFQLPWIPEWSVRRGNFAAFVRAFRADTPPGTFTDEDLVAYRSAWRQPGATTAAIDWYRAAARRPQYLPRKRVDAPTLVIWGERDRYLVPEMAPDSIEYCTDGRIERFPQTSHWVPHERPGAVSSLLVDHLD